MNEVKVQIGEDIKTKLLAKIHELTDLDWQPNKKEVFEEAFRKIAEILLDSHFEIGEGDQKDIIYPLWIEAYYCNPGKGYIDMTMDAAKKKTGDCEKPWPKGHGQVDRFGYLYFTTPNTTKANPRKSRVDIVLSNGETYALSFLFKGGYVYINDKKDEGFLKADAFWSFLRALEIEPGQISLVQGGFEGAYYYSERVYQSKTPPNDIHVYDEIAAFIVPESGKLKKHFEGLRRRDGKTSTKTKSIWNQYFSKLPKLKGE